MHLTTLVENSALTPEFGCEHGLSFYLETKQGKILVDVGASNLFLTNAAKLKVDIGAVDYLIISHGHYDHGGGLHGFLQANSKAQVFVTKQAFGRYFAQRPGKPEEYIGLDASLQDNSRLVFTGEYYEVAPGLEVFSHIPHQVPGPSANASLYMEQDGKQVRDSFAHEQMICLEEDGKLFLFTGCAHNGIINLLEYFRTLKGRMPDYVLGGFHLAGKSAANCERPEQMAKLGKYLKQTSSKFYTCHCTGLEAYETLRTVLGSQIAYLASGAELEL